MTKIKAYLPISVLGLCYLVGMIIVMNSHLLHGGHEVMLFNALEPIANNETLAIKGMLTLMPSSETSLSKIMTVNFGLDGFMNIDGQGEVDISYIQPYENNESVIAQLQQHESQLWLVPIDPTISPIDLSHLFGGAEDNEAPENYWSDIYEHLSIDRRHVKDPRINNGYLKRAVTNYHLELLGLLDEWQLEELEIALGIEAIEVMATSLDIQVDNEGDLMVIYLNANTSVFNISGWLTLLP